jgi:hypothetical protein
MQFAALDPVEALNIIRQAERQLLTFSNPAVSMPISPQPEYFFFANEWSTAATERPERTEKDDRRAPVEDTAPIPSPKGGFW